MTRTHGGRGPDSCRESAPESHLDNSEMDGGAHGLESHTLEGLLGKALEKKPVWEKPIWAGLWESVCAAFFAPGLPPLELTSMPIAIRDPMASRTNPWAVGTSAVVNGGLLALLLCLGLSHAASPPKPLAGPHIDLDGLNRLSRLTGQALQGGGGGGARELIDPSRGAPPRVELMSMAPPQVPLIEQPKLAVDPAVAMPIKLPENVAMPNVGVATSANVKLASNGPGGPAGIGSNDGGVGPGWGPGVGPGGDGGMNGGIYQPGVGGVIAPIPVVTPEAEFSDEARRAKYQGVCLISLIVDAQGMPRNPRLVQRLGMGLDEKALAAVLRYRFKPAKRNGKPVAVMITVEVNFRLY
jgi:TonB family protein